MSPVTHKDSVLDCIEQVRKIRVDDSLDDYILSIIQETRQSPFLELGASPRGSISLRRVAQANAFLEGRTYAIPDDIKANAVQALAHRVILKSVSGDSESAEAEKIVREIVERVPVPV